MIRPIAEQVRISMSEVRCEMMDYLKLAEYDLARGGTRDAIHSLIVLAEDGARNARELLEALDA